MDIKKYSIYFQLLYLILSGKVIWAQNDNFINQNIGKQYLIQGLNISSDGSWISFKKMYESNNDTIQIFKNEPNFTSFSKTHIRQLEFLNQNKILFLKSDTVELVDYKKNKTKEFTNVKKMTAFEVKNQFLLHFDTSKMNTLKIFNQDGDNLLELKNTIYYTLSPSKDIYTITLQNNLYEIYLIKDLKQIKLYTSSDKITQIYLDKKETGIIILSENRDNPLIKKLDYVDKISKICIASKTIKTENILSLRIKYLKEAELYGVEIWKKKKNENLIAEIWHSQDKSLEETHFIESYDVNYLWDIKKNQLKLLGNQSHNKISFLENERFILNFNPYKYQDYTQLNNYLDVSIYNIETDKYEFLDKINSTIYSANNGNLILYNKDNDWIICDLINSSKKVIPSSKTLKSPSFSLDDKYIVFNSTGGLWKYDIQKNRLNLFLEFKGYDVNLQNYKRESLLGGYNIYKSSIDLKLPLIIELTTLDKSKNSLIIVEKGIKRNIISNTDKYISQITYDSLFNNIVYQTENFNNPPEINIYNKVEGNSILYKSNKLDKDILNLKQEIIYYKNLEGEVLSGILYYPLNYNPFKKYPLVVHIYEKQNSIRNLYLTLSYSEGVGFNIRTLLEKGYFVYLPDIKVGKNGPGISALDCVNNAINAIKSKSIDKSNMALIGHSFGGYLTNFIATHSDLFKTYIAGAGNSDLINSYHSYNYEFLYPEFKRIESSIYQMKFPFSINKDLYFKNNPIYFAENVNSPILLWSGKLDQNVPMNETMSFFLALKRNNKKVTALFYPNEHHSLKNPLAQKHLTIYILDWLDSHLKVY